MPTDQQERKDSKKQNEKAEKVIVKSKKGKKNPQKTESAVFPKSFSAHSTEKK